jgi:cation transport ATPase
MNVFLGNRHILENNGIEVPKFTKTSVGATILYLALNKTAYMVLIINTHSNLRPEAVKVIELLMKNNKK